MRLVIFSAFLALLMLCVPVAAQSISDNLPPVIVEGIAAEPAARAKEAPVPVPTESYTVTDVNVDVKADTAAHARDQALMQAERQAYGQLCTRLGIPDTSAKMTDDALAALVQSFEIQSEKLSSVRAIGVYTIHFNPAAVQKKTGVTTAPAAENKAAPQGTLSHLPVSVQTESLNVWAQIKRRLGAIPSITKVDTLALGRGQSRLDLSYTGSLDELKQAVTVQGFVLRPLGDGWELTDGSMVPR